MLLSFFFTLCCLSYHIGKGILVTEKISTRLCFLYLAPFINISSDQFTYVIYFQTALIAKEAKVFISLFICLCIYSFIYILIYFI